ncbi:MULTISPECIES: hypothetical protein [Methylobacterium]|mgnify:CR=1 FL=1|jgi:hypothetical protein|uniref:Exopolysaccharide production protein YjbE n=2 Tax=Methylobacterium TaxID=407 RepID=A0A0C6F743_9HYPH|nr:MULTISPECIES: hypothetical protein [Methylobacterium]MBK3398364.1 hypothetical protein [Methylobacterium ajmalii]MBK3410481.1 hypothetical protein [Methylobacterium ajmalii]MBK3421049.1 hypothetical protein [Methylobacterium ajmalii]MBZ6416878.1 hypothetical protein [Methylobacterium sp.]SEO43975.1 hypothetical protein SAMN04487843_101394 [Methylobacterium sp. ap11]
MTRLAAIGAGLFLLAGTLGAAAGPCAPGQTAQKMDKTSNVDPSATASVSPGAKAESPGTVGAMQNVGSQTATSPSDVSRQSKGEKTAAQQANDC